MERRLPQFVAGDPGSFAARCIDLYTDEGLWNRLRKAAIERIGQEDCSPELFENRLQSIILNGHRAAKGIRKWP